MIINNNLLLAGLVALLAACNGSGPLHPALPELSGVVVDSRGEPVAEARLTMVDHTVFRDNHSVSVVSNENGYFHFPLQYQHKSNLSHRNSIGTHPAGFSVVVEQPGYAAATVRVPQLYPVQDSLTGLVVVLLPNSAAEAGDDGCSLSRAMRYARALYTELQQHAAGTWLCERVEDSVLFADSLDLTIGAYANADVDRGQCAGLEPTGMTGQDFRIRDLCAYPQ